MPSDELVFCVAPTSVDNVQAPGSVTLNGTPRVKMPPKELSSRGRSDIRPLGPPAPIARQVMIRLVVSLLLSSPR